VAVRRAKGTGRWPRKLYRDSASVLSQYRAETDVAPEVATQVALLRSMFRGLFFLDIQPRLMRGQSQLGRTLGLNGEHIAAAVHALTPSQRADVVDWLAELCAPKVTDLKTEFVSQVQEVYLLLEEQGSARISARSLSDGTLRFLGTLVALLTAPPGAVVLLEEPDVGLHPARIHLLAEFLESVTASRQIQVIATSHSPVLLAHLSDNAFGNVLAFDREPQGPTVVRQVRNLPNVGEVMKPEHRARLIATGWLERAA
jgi:predicted ATPase